VKDKLQLKTEEIDCEITKLSKRLPNKTMLFLFCVRMAATASYIKQCLFKRSSTADFCLTIRRTLSLIAGNLVNVVTALGELGTEQRA